MATLKVVVLKLHLKIGTPVSDPKRKLPPSSLLIWSNSSDHLSPQAWPSHWNITAEIGHKQLRCTTGIDLDYLFKIFSLASIRVLQQASYPHTKGLGPAARPELYHRTSEGPLRAAGSCFCSVPPLEDDAAVPLGAGSGPTISNHVFSGSGP